MFDDGDEFWDFLRDESGAFVENAVLAELHDYKFLLDEVPTVYWSITDGLMSKPHYYARDVLSVHEGCIEGLIREAVREALTRAKTEDLEGLIREFED